MQKKLIVLAVAAAAASLSAAAFAQTNVTIYGVADVTFESVKAEGSSYGLSDSDLPRRNRVTSNSSLIGFRGTEDLGNGLSAIFQFETGINLDGGSGNPQTSTALSSSLIGSARDSFVGVSSKSMGTLTLGNHSSPWRKLSTSMDPNPGATGIGSNTRMMTSMDTEEDGVTTMVGFDRVNSSVMYTSPSMNGLSAAVIYGANENRRARGDSEPRSDHVWGLGLNYGNGPIYIGYAYEERNDKNVDDNDEKTIGHLIGARYTLANSLGNTTVGVQWNRIKLKDLDWADEEHRTAWALSLSHAMGPHNIIAHFSKVGDRKGDGANSETGAKMWELGYNYSLSKRTMIKAYYVQIRNERNANYDFYIPIGSTSSQGVGGANSNNLDNGQDPQGFGIGVRHSF